MHQRSAANTGTFAFRAAYLCVTSLWEPCVPRPKAATGLESSVGAWRNFMSRSGLLTLLGTCLLLAGVNGCSVYTKKSDKTGKDKDVDIRTPFGSLSVHKGASDVKATGLNAYPAAQLKKYLDDDEGRATVNIDSSFFGLKVAALKHQNNDDPDKILNFYRKGMAKCRKVLDRTGGFAMAFERRDRHAEVACNDHRGSDHSYREELNVGTEYSQRI